MGFVQWIGSRPLGSMVINTAGWPHTALWNPVETSLIKCFMRQIGWIWSQPLVVRLIRMTNRVASSWESLPEATKV